MQTFAGTKLEHYCRVDDMPPSFSDEERRAIAIPKKASTEVEECVAFDYDYERLDGMSLDHALEQVGNNRSRRPCRAWTFNTTAASYSSSIQQDVSVKT